MTAKMGGQETLRLLLKGSGDLTDALLSTSEGGQKIDLGLAERVAQKSGGRTKLEVSTEGRSSMAEYAAQLAADDTGPSVHPDIVVLSLAPDVFVDRQQDSPGFLASAATVIETLKERGSHILIFNASTIDPSRPVSDYHGIEEPFTRKAQRLDLALLQLSISHGISIIDADRILAELGGEQHVVAALDYSPTACDALCEETLRVIDDYGFFEARPVMDQVGQQGKEAS